MMTMMTIEYTQHYPKFLSYENNYVIVWNTLKLLFNELAKMMTKTERLPVTATKTTTCTKTTR